MFETIIKTGGRVFITTGKGGFVIEIGQVEKCGREWGAYPPEVNGRTSPDALFQFATRREAVKYLARLWQRNLRVA